MLKTSLIFVLLIFTIPVFAQGNKYNEKFKPEETKFTGHIADSLLNLKQLYRVYAEYGDYIGNHCLDSISAIYGFKPYFFSPGCFPVTDKERDTIEAFNRHMDTAITALNGPGWEQKLKIQDSLCARCFCELGDSADYYMHYALVGFNGFVYKKGQVQLNDKQRCLANRWLIKSYKEILEVDTNFRIIITGHSTKDEEDSKQSISRQRAENFAAYLVQQGVSNKHIDVEWKGTTQNYYPEVYLTDRNVSCTFIFVQSK